jgi:hypothetical protein
MTWGGGSSGSRQEAVCESWLYCYCCLTNPKWAVAGWLAHVLLLLCRCRCPTFMVPAVSEPPQSALLQHLSPPHAAHSCPFHPAPFNPIHPPPHLQPRQPQLLHQVHSRLQDVAALARDQLGKRPRKEPATASRQQQQPQQMD